MTAPGESIAGTHSLDAIEAVVQRFEAAWVNGVQPNIDDFLSPADPKPRRLVIELIHADLELRHKGGESVRVKGYLQRYAELAHDTRAVVDLLVREFDLRRRREPSLGIDDYRRRFPRLHNELAGRIAPGTPARAPTNAPIDNVEALSLLLRQGAILEQPQVEELAKMQGRFTEPKALAKELLQRGWLTPFQINQLFKGKAHELTLDRI